MCIIRVVLLSFLPFIVKCSASRQVGNAISIQGADTGNEAAFEAICQRRDFLLLLNRVVLVNEQYLVGTGIVFKGSICGQVTRTIGFRDFSRSRCLL